MAVEEFLQPNFVTQLPAAYKDAIDDSIETLHKLGGAFAPHEAATANMTVTLDAGKFYSNGLVSKAEQTTSTIVAPSVNPRIDRLAVSPLTGDVVRIPGAEAASPVAPEYPYGFYPICQFQLATSTTTITNSMITDERGLSAHPLDPMATALYANFWTNQTTPNLFWRDVAWSPELGLFAAVASNGTGDGVITSPDGVTWTSRTPATDNSWYGIDWSPELGLFAAVSEDGTSNSRVMTSPDGINWTTQTSAADNSWRNIIWAGGTIQLFVANSVTGTGNRVMTSPDGETWTTRAPADGLWNKPVYSPELDLIAMPDQDLVGSQLSTSPDGINWTTRTTPTPAKSWTDVAWSPELGLFCACAAGGVTQRIMTSPNGTDWTLQYSAVDNDWEAITWSPELRIFCAISNDGTDRVMTSPDGINWTNRPDAATALSYESVVWAAELGIFCAISSSGTTSHCMTSRPLL